MSDEFCEELLGDSCEDGPEVSIPLPGPDSVFAVLGVAKLLVYDREDGSPEDSHPFEGGDVFVMASPPSEDGAQILVLVGPGLQVTGRGIVG